ncbi:cbb3-type cytochrome oxidase subunit 3 [Amantichitinum ursilacus]|uniref:Cbb3-type cytochrome oxidase component FixQ n=1 Tax=Amantichitinum ursilacus TaxID=857265 RepID=A0A0N0GR44_9NEIS|nr:cbb3-type cytochrome c oxidase subunit 3 [Amantichitinum ursilacus]KPC55089.1 Cbb3-type cytochrome oxidase component FixQ [Amantichitinum ursilacus]
MEWQDFLRIGVTVLGFLCFVAIIMWAFSKGTKPEMDEAAQAVLLDDDLPHAEHQ